MKYFSLSFVFLLFPALSFGFSPMDFSKGFSINLEPGAPLQRVELTIDVYAAGLRSDLGDMRIFNGSGKAVPMHLRSLSPSSAPQFQQSTVSLPVFRLNANEIQENLKDDYRMQVTTSDTGTVISVQRQERTESRHEALLVDATAARDAIGALGVDLNTPFPRLVSVSVQGSDDLSSWHAAGTGTLARIEHDNGKILKNRIPLQNGNWKYYILKTDADLSLLGPVTGIPKAKIPTPVSRYRWTALEGKKIEEGLYEYHLPETLPISRLDLNETENTVLAVTVQVPAEGNQWRRVQQGSLFRLNMDGKSISSDPLVVSGPLNRFRIAVKGSSASLRIGWIPHEAVFMPQGPPPFILAVGNPTVLKEDLLAPMLSGIDQSRIGLASLGNMEVLSSEDKTGVLPLKPSVPYSKIVLWGILGLGVLILAGMAWNLVKKAK